MQHRLVETSLCKEQFDAERKLVRSEVSGGMAGAIYAIRYFRWEGFALVATAADEASARGNQGAAPEDSSRERQGLPE